jgi:hypothetical protein
MSQITVDIRDLPEDPFYGKDNQECLMRSIMDLEAGRDLVYKSIEELKAMEDE